MAIRGTTGRVVAAVGAGLLALPAACASRPAPEAGAGCCTGGSARSGVSGPAQAGPAAVLAGLTMAQRVGQLLLVGAPLTGSTAATAAAISAAHAGAVILTGRTTAGVAGVAARTAALRGLATAASTGGVPLLVATDQEGGYVQTLAGPGFATIPTALAQGGLPASTLAARAQGWGRQLAAAGVDLDLAPVADTVPPDIVAVNQPIGRYQREYGTSPAAVSPHADAVLLGLAAAGVGATAKHFPGLGRVVGNTDTTAGVVDRVTTPDDPYVVPFETAAQSGATAVMVSLATYDKIDPTRIAAFSPTVIGLLRRQLGFGGVVVSDDLGNAAAVAGLPAGQRALDFLGAGGDLVLTVDPALAAPMAAAVLQRAAADPAFAAAVDAAALRVLIAKQRLGLLGGAAAPVLDSAGTLHVLQRGDSGQLQVRTAAGGGWSAAQPLGGRLTAGPGGAAQPSGGLLAAAAGTGGVVYLDAWRSGQPGAWTDLGGATTAAPAVAASAAGTDVVVRGTDGALWVRHRPAAGSWSGWSGLGGEVSGAPAAAVTASGSLVVTAVGTDRQVWQRVRSGAGWSPWTSLGGLAIGAPALATDGSGTHLFVRGANSALWERTRSASGSWSGWQSLGGDLVAPPTATGTTVGAGSTTVLAEGTDARLYARTATAGGAFAGWTALPF